MRVTYGTNFYVAYMTYFDEANSGIITKEDMADTTSASYARVLELFEPYKEVVMANPATVSEFPDVPTDTSTDEEQVTEETESTIVTDPTPEPSNETTDETTAETLSETETPPEAEISTDTSTETPSETEAATN